MFQASSLMLIYCTSPVHMGSGTALGTIDNPIQRERHTQHPMMAGSGLKGALRHEAVARWDVPSLQGDQAPANDARNKLEACFGPEKDAADHAGAVAVSDAQLILFPVRSAKESFVYATSPTVLARLSRLCAQAGLKPPPLPESPPSPDVALVRDPALLGGGFLVLEAFRLAPKVQPDESALAQVAAWLASRVIPGDETTAGAGWSFFQEKLRKHIVVLSDERFDHFVQNATAVEPHVRINDETGTADDGGLFYTENLPPESVLVSLIMASASRRRGVKKTASEVLGWVRDEFSEKVVQVGGDATTGRGQVHLRFTGEEGA